ncbi:methyltransferase [Halococcus hamelinensis]|uniref:methyltransferase n=1 Tax=Halococcus hamelinensis TaxID=332168 RepID=UPI001ED97A30|nr:methyltransferase [Halococcus hamelinensis]
MTGDPRVLELESRVSASRSVYRFRTTDGVHSKRSFRTAELLLLDALWDSALGDCCCLEATYGVVGCVLAGRVRSVRMTESSARAARLCERNASANGVEAVTTLTADPRTLDERFDAVTYAPKPYTPLSMGRQRIANGLAVLRPGGSFSLAAAKHTGLTRYEACLRDLAASVERVAERDEFVVLRATRPPTFDPPPFVSPRTTRTMVDDTELSLVTLPGVFSAAGLDDGTRLLLETTTVEDGDRVLDLCCGSGAIGTYAARVADCDVRLTDDDCVATCCAERTLAASGVTGSVVTADCTDGVAGPFDRVLCNPPTHAGWGVLTDLFAGAREVLAPGGAFVLVHHRDLDLRAHLSGFETVEILRTSEEHVVLRASR